MPVDRRQKKADGKKTEKIRTGETGGNKVPPERKGRRTKMRILDGGERDGDAKTTRRVTRYTTHLEERLRRMEERERKRERERERTAQPAVCVAHRVEEEEEEEVVESDTREQRPRGLVQVSGTRVCVCVCEYVSDFLDCLDSGR